MSIRKKILASCAGGLMGLSLASTPAAAFEFGAFADVRFTYNDLTGKAPTTSPGESPNGFAIGGLDLYTTQKISDDTTAFFEVVFEGDTGFVLDVERYWVKHEFSKALNISAGRFHSPLGFWSRNYHHGVLIQDTVSRPFFLDFEDADSGVLPMHVVGLMATGDLGNGVGYELSVANNSQIDTSTVPVADREIIIGNGGDFANGKSIFGRVTYGMGDLHLGLFTMLGSMVDDGGTLANAGDELVEQTIVGLDLRYAINDFDLLAEVYTIDTDSALSSGANDAGSGATSDGKSHSSDAFYIQGGYRFREDMKAVVRYAALDFDDGLAGSTTDFYYALLGTKRQDQTTLALRYDIDDSNAVTLEYNMVNYEDPSWEDHATLTANWSFLLF